MLDLLGFKLCKTAITHLWERRKMKKRDKEINLEREEERGREQQTPETTLKHFTHDHPLHRRHPSSADEQCSSCHVSIPASGWAYACSEAGCTYVLHEVCCGPKVTLQQGMAAAAPHRAPSGALKGSETTTFAHSKHTVMVAHSNHEFRCDHCFTTGEGRRYKCTDSDCEVFLHPVCGKHPTRLSTFMHPQHELELWTKKWFKKCQICRRTKAGHKALNLRVYGCKKCNFWVHPTCSQLPQYLVHSLHPMADDPSHKLQLTLVQSGGKSNSQQNKKSGKSRKCEAKSCGKKCKTGWQYKCDPCGVSCHIKCIVRSSVEGNSKRGLPNMIKGFLDVADDSGITDIATSLLST